MCTSLIVFVRGKCESSDQQRSFFQGGRSEQLCAVSTFERVYCVDISHGNCGHSNLTVI